MKAIEYLGMESFSSAYGWTPNQIKEMTVEDRRAYIAIRVGRADASVGSNPSPQEKRTLGV